MSKKAVKARQRAQHVLRSGAVLAIDHKDFIRLLRDWGWTDADSTDANVGSGHQKFRWHGHQVNFSRPHGGIERMLPRVVAERAAEIMGMSIVELLTGPTLDNPGVAKAIARAEQIDNGELNRWSNARDRLGVDIGDLTNAQGDDDVDLTFDVEDPDPADHTPPTISTYPLDCPREYCSHALVSGTCPLHGRPLHLPEPDEPLTGYHLDAFLEVSSFIDLEPPDRRIYLALQRRLKDEGLLTEDDTRPLTPRDVPSLTRHTNGSTVMAGTDRAVTPQSPGKDDMAITELTEEEQEATRQKMLRATQIKKEKDAARKAAAPSIGQARNIDQVLQRTTGTIFPARRHILEALCNLGGRVHHDGGKATALLIPEVERVSGKKIKASSTITSLIASMEADDQLARNTNAKQTYDIMVLDPLVEVKKVEEEVAKEPEIPSVPDIPPPPEPELVEQASQPIVEHHAVAPQPAPVIERVPTPPITPPPAAPVAPPITPPAPPIPTITDTSTDSDLWDLLDILLGDLTLTFSRDTVTAFNVWANATRALLDLAE